MSELLERVQREIRERLEASRAAVREHERLEAALHALSDAGSRATRVVTGRGTQAPSRSAPASSAARPRAKPAARAGKSAAARGGAKRAARSSGAPAKRRRSRATTTGGRQSTPGAAGAAASGDAETTRAGGAAKPKRKRAARGANREAVLAVIAARPGVSARELAAASGVRGGTLYALLRGLTDEGTLEKRELASRQSGYATAASAPSAADNAAAERAATTSEPAAAATTQPGTDAQVDAPSPPQQDRTADTEHRPARPGTPGP